MGEVMVPIPVPGFADPVCSISHLVAAAVFAVLAYGLLREGRGHPGRVLALGVFALACVFLLVMSGVYHMLPRGSEARMVMQRLDHAAIFTLIAATFTAPHAILFRGVWRWGMILLIWGLALTALTLKTLFFEQIPELVGVLLYLGLGWIGVVSGAKLWRMHQALVVRLAAGGVAYTVGAICEFLRWPVLVDGVVGPHELFHVAVIAGVGFHWWFVYGFAHGRHRPVSGLARGKAVYALDEHTVDELVGLYEAQPETEGRGREDVRRLLSHSLPVGLVDDQGDLIACARVLSDRATLALILDVTLADARPDDAPTAEELADKLLEAVLAHPELERVERIGLLCPPTLPAGLAERWGFSSSHGDAVRWRAS